MLLSIGLMVKNESKHLEQCLRSLTPILDSLDSELVIVDTGSTDNTVQIARQYTENVFHHEWFDDFSEMRNVVLGYTTGEWFFYLDGDEVVEDPSGIIQFFESRQYKNFNSAFIEMRNPYSSKDTDKYGVFQALRFFVKDEDFHFKGIVHEQPQAKGPVARIDGHIVHYGYVGDDKELMEYKFQRNVALINRVLDREPDNIYHLFQLSQSYAMYGKPKDALGPIERAYVLAKDRGLSNYMNVVTQLAKVRFHNKMFRESEAICKEGIALKDGYIDLYYFQAMSQVELGKYEEAIANLDHFLSLVEDYLRGDVKIDFTLAHHTLTYEEHAYVMLCAIHTKLGNFDRAVDYGEMVTSPLLAKEAIKNLIDIYLKEEKYVRLRQLYDVWSQDESVADFIIERIENKRLDLKDEARRELALLFSNEETPFGLLNLARSHIHDSEVQLPEVIWQRLDDLRLATQPDYYADLILIRTLCQRPVMNILSGYRSDKISRSFGYLIHVHEGFFDALKESFDDERSWLHDLCKPEEAFRIKTSLIYALLQHESKLTESEYRRYFQMYLDVGMKYLETCYDIDILDGGNIAWAKTGADGFLFVMRGVRNTERHTVEYVRGLREALAQDSSMKRGVDLLLGDVQEGIKNPEQAEFEKLKESVRTAISEKMSTGELETAAVLINEYEDIVGNDAPLCAAKGILHMLFGDFDEAERAFLKGLGIEPDNGDLLFNLAYLHESIQEYVQAIRLYEKAIRNSSDPHLVSDSRKAILRCGSMDRVGLEDQAKKLDVLERSLREKYKL